MSNTTSIKCPDCGNQIDVNDILKHQIEDGLRKEFLKEKMEQDKKQTQNEEELAKKVADFEAKRKQQNELFKAELDKKAKEAEKEIELRLKSKLQDENKDSLEAMQKELAEKSEKVKDLLKKEAEIEKLKREVSEATDAAKLAAEKELTAKLTEERSKIKRQADEENELKMKEVLKQLADQKKLTDDMKRKQEQGSMQLQGEVQEIALEELLSVTYPFDSITEVAKGVKGADCKQEVRNAYQKVCGSIIYESKRTKNFGADWVEKLKQDQLLANADIAVIVTETLPNGMDRFGQVDGVWVCGFHEVKSLSLALRQTLLMYQQAKSTQENKGDKMELLYAYLTSQEFAQNINRIAENYTEMEGQLAQEKRAMEKQWKKREKQIWVTQQNISSLFGSIQGIAGKDLPIANALELSGEEDE